MAKIFELGFVFLVVSMTAFLAVPEQDFQFAMFKMMKCKIEPKFAYQNFSCRVKSLNRSFTTFSMIGVSKFPLYNIFVSFLKIKCRLEPFSRIELFHRLRSVFCSSMVLYTGKRSKRL